MRGYARAMTLRVRTLGALELDLDGVELPLPAGRPGRTLLAWLALHPGTHARSAVAAALWPDVLDASARASLRTALSAVRRALGPASAALRADRERVELSEDVAVDLREFDRLLDSGEPEAALDLARGELLPDLDDDWVLRERDRHRARCGVALAALAQAAAEPEEALAWSRRRAELDPLDEAAHRDLMSALAAAGETASALAVYDRLRVRMRRELGLLPSSASRDLAAALRTGQSQQGEQPTAAAEAASRAQHLAFRREDSRARPPRCDPSRACRRGRWRRRRRGRARHRQEPPSGEVRRRAPCRRRHRPRRPLGP